MHVYLTGFMGAGKSTVGRALANLLHRSFVDLDESIEDAAGRTIAEIFASQGEAGFRRLESQALRSVDDADPKVIATGGGVLSSQGNREWMKIHGMTFWLDVPFSVVLERLTREELETRPLFASQPQALELYQMRRNEYSDSDRRIEVSSSDSVAALAARIHKMLMDQECAT